jgi:hypothetical protein
LCRCRAKVLSHDPSRAGECSGMLQRLEEGEGQEVQRSEGAMAR